MSSPLFVYISLRFVILRSSPVMCVLRTTLLSRHLVLPLHLHVQVLGCNTVIFNIQTTRLRQIWDVWDRLQHHKVSAVYKGRKKYLCMQLMSKRWAMRPTSKWWTRPKKGTTSLEMGCEMSDKLKIKQKKVKEFINQMSPKGLWQLIPNLNDKQKEGIQEISFRASYNY